MRLNERNLLASIEIEDCLPISPILVVAIGSPSMRVPLTIAVTLVGLILLGVAGARLGGAPPVRAAVRVLVGGTLALLISMAIGSLTGSAV